MDSDLRSLLRIYKGSPSDDLAHRITQLLLRSQTEPLPNLYAILYGENNPGELLFQTINPIPYQPGDTEDSLFKRWLNVVFNEDLIASQEQEDYPGDLEFIEYLQTDARPRIRGAWIVSQSVGELLEKIIPDFAATLDAINFNDIMEEAVKKIAIEDLKFTRPNPFPMHNWLA